jgi:hypothetical protein
MRQSKNEEIPVRMTPARGDEGGALRQRIADKAYELFVKRGRDHGHDLEDWLEAERSVLDEVRAAVRPAAPGASIRPAPPAPRQTGRALPRRPGH